MLDTAPEAADNLNHNGPPAHVTWDDHAEALIEEAEGMTAITTEAQAASVGELAEKASKAKRDADKARADTKKPHLDAGKAVDADFKPVIAKFDQVKGVTSALLTPWIAEQRRIEREAADKARAEQAAKDAELRRIAAEADKTDIAEMKKVADAGAEAREASAAAKIARSQKTTVAGVRMRTVREGSMDDRKALLTHIAKTDPEYLTTAAAEWMRKAVNRGDKAIPGVTITEKQVAK